MELSKSLGTISMLKCKLSFFFAGMVIGWGILWARSRHPPVFDESPLTWMLPAETDRSSGDNFQVRFEELINGLHLRGAASGGAWETLKETVDGWMLTDPIKCLNYLAKHGSTILINDEMLNEAIAAKFGSNLLSALRQAGSIDDSRLRRKWYDCTFHLLARSDPAAAFEAISSVPKYLQNSFSAVTQEEWSRTDPDGMLNTLAKKGQLAWAVEALSKNSPEKAFEALLSQGKLRVSSSSKDKSMTELLKRVLDDIATTSLERALDFANKLPESNIRLTLKRRYISKIAESNPQKALELAQEIKGDMERLNIIKAILGASKQPMQEGSTLGERALSELITQPLMLRSLTHPKEAAAEVSEISEPIARADAMRVVIHTWSLTQMNEAAEFAANQYQDGNGAWLRTFVDEALNNSGAAPTWIRKLSNSAREMFMNELSARPPNRAREDLLRALQDQ